MPLSCIVKGCASVQTPNSYGLLFYQLPWNNIQLRTEWVKRAGYNPYNADDVKHITKEHCICNRHFSNNKTNNQMVPTINLPGDVCDGKPDRCKPNILRRHKAQEKKTGNNSKSSVSKKHHNLKQKSAFKIDDTCIPAKKPRKAIHSSSSLLDDEPSITETSVDQSEPINPVKEVESPLRPDPVQSPFTTYKSSHVIPAKQKPSLIVSNHQQSLMTNISSLWEAGKLCDAIISNGTANVKIHKIVLSSMCPKMLTIFDNGSQTKFPKVNFPTTASKETLMAFAEYLYNGVLDLDVKILEQLKTIAQWLEMKDFEQLCDDQLKIASINDDCNSNLELVPADVKQEVCSNNSEDMNFDLGVAVEEYNITTNEDSVQVKEEPEEDLGVEEYNITTNEDSVQVKEEPEEDLGVEEYNITTNEDSVQVKEEPEEDLGVEECNITTNEDSVQVKEEPEDNYIQIEVKQEGPEDPENSENSENPEDQNYASGVFQYNTNNDTFLTDFSSQDRNFSFAPTSDVQQNASYSQLTPFPVSFRQSSNLLPTETEPEPEPEPVLEYQNVHEPVIRPVGYFTPTSEQKLITKEMLNMISLNSNGNDDNTMKKKYDT